MLRSVAPALVLGFLGLLSSYSLLGSDERPADLILTGGTVYIEPRTASTPKLVKEPPAHTQAIALRGGDIVRIGTAATVMALKGAQTRVIDIKGKTVLPAFHDGYVRLLQGGLRLIDEDATAKDIVVRKALEKAQDELIKAGFVSISGPAGVAEVAALKAMALEGHLNLRLELWGDLEQPDEFIKLAEEQKKLMLQERMRFSGVMGELDGDLLNRTAALLAPYDDAPDVSGVVKFEQDKLNKLVLDANKKGLSVILKATGDRAVNMAITAFGTARKLLFNNTLRNRIIGADIVQEGVRGRFSDLGITVVAEPDILVPEPGEKRVHFISQRLGHERAKLAYPWHTMSTAGTRLVFGSTWPERELAPLKSILAALTRPGLDNSKESLTIEHALWAFTANPAHATREEHVKGGLAEGKFADLIVLSHDPYRLPKKTTLDQVKVLMTIAGGKVVFEAP